MSGLPEEAPADVARRERNPREDEFILREILRAVNHNAKVELHGTRLEIDAWIDLSDEQAERVRGLLAGIEVERWT